MNNFLTSKELVIFDLFNYKTI
ncbi:Hypothetical Protein MfeM64YM_0960 [Mycoplasmopsis fermentans M64]|uniref:Uncharacterized protein n=1 Tax=Mycoplasmopsis fermentans (strain M64) TaxID=943945 RepID=A0AB32XD12_MYCFM|nr:Hypothetical Protein MfeM64YM_0960 [Mycoplasmopsis fermentans M64]